MRYGGGRHNKFIDRKQQIHFTLELAVKDPGQIMKRAQVETSPDPQPASEDSEGSS